MCLQLLILISERRCTILRPKNVSLLILIVLCVTSDHKSWSIARGNFSYSDKPKFSTQGTSTVSQPDDILDTRNTKSPNDEFDMVQKKNLLNSKLRMAGGMMSIKY